MSDEQFKCFMTHVGVRVSDIERSTRFYCEGFGFEKLYDIPVGNEAAKLADVEEFSSYMRILKSPTTGAVIELIVQSVPEHNWARPDENTYGLYHISLNVSDVEEGLRRIKELGGTVYPKRAGSMDIPGAGTMNIAFGADPDGQVLELIAKA
jgi:catechol 2,3-dioxygenase-like lactoylglutathione lyase family enzyme